MRFKTILGVLLSSIFVLPTVHAQGPICIDGRCQMPLRQQIRRPLWQPFRRQLQQPTWQSIDQTVETPIQRPVIQDSPQPNIQHQEVLPSNTILLSPLQEEVFVRASELEAVARVSAEDHFDQIIKATVRVSVNNVCGSGTIVGRDGQGNAIVLTNAHVAGTSRGRTVNVERWGTDGTSQRGRGSIIASGYGRGMSIDFALLRCNSEFARDVTPVPLAERYPDTSAAVTTYGCPRCEWPSMQVLRMNRSEGQVLTWKPEAIGGRSGSSVIDHTDAGPRVVGLLTWGGNGEGLGQSTPFLLNAMRGRLPRSIQSLPDGVREVDSQDVDNGLVFCVPATTSGEALQIPISSEAAFQGQDDLIDSITEPAPSQPQPDNNPGVGKDDPEPEEITGLGRREVAELLAGGAATGVIILLLIQYGIPFLMAHLRKIREDRGEEPLLTQEQFDELVERLQELARGLAIMETRFERKDGPDK